MVNLASLPRAHISFISRFARCIGGWTLAALLVPAGAWAGNFSVAPIRMELDRNSKTASVTVTNADANTPLRAQVQLFEWTQDAEGKDQYRESNDLTYFPRMMAVPASGPQLVRAGIRAPATDRERTYRLFIEEIPPPRKPEDRSTAVAVAVRFGVPVFVRPIQESPAGEIESVRAYGGKLALRVRNTGNVHFMIKSIDLQGGGGFSQQVQGWYLLAGAARTYDVPISGDACRRLGSLGVKIATDRMPIEHSIKIDPATCR